MQHKMIYINSVHLTGGTVFIIITIKPLKEGEVLVVRYALLNKRYGVLDSVSV